MFVCGGLCPWCTSKRSLWHVFVDARMPHIETKIGISYGFQMFSIVSSLGAVNMYGGFSYVIIHSLCSFKVTCIHTSNISSIACSDIFVAVSSCNSGVWTKWGLWGQSSLSGLAHSDEIAEAWRAGADTAMMLFIERSGDFYITISLMEGELPRGKVLNTGTCKLVQWTLARHEGDCKWGYLWWDASTVDAGRR